MRKTIAPGIYVSQLQLSRGDTRWYMYTRHPLIAGGRRKILWKGPDREAAVDRANRTAERLAAAGSPNIPIKDLLRRWEDEHFHAALIRRSTQTLYKGHIRNHLVPAFGKIPACELRVQTLIDYMSGELQGLRGAALDRRWPTIRSRLVTLKAALNWYWREHAEGVEGFPNPQQRVVLALERAKRRYQPRSIRKQHLLPEQVPILLEAAQETSPLAHDFLAVAYRTGLRRGEILGLRWCEVDWERCLLDDGTGCGPRYQIDVRGQPAVLKSDRHMPVRFAPILLTVLRERLKVRNSDTWIFATASGKPVNPRNASRAVEAARRRAEKKGIPFEASNPHAARHLVRSLAPLNGWSPAEIRAQLGHASGAMDRIYEHALPREDAMEWASFTGRVQ